MTKKSLQVLIPLLCITLCLKAQQDSSKINTSSDLKLASDGTSLWRSGKAKYAPRPKDMWEIGLHGGHYFIDGDVDPRLPGYGFGIHIRKAIHYVFSVRADAMFGTAYGLDPQPAGENLENEAVVFAGYGANNRWFPSYRTQYYYGAIEGILNIGNILFHKDRNTWNWYLILGIGLDMNKTMLDLKDANGQVYSKVETQIGWTSDKYNTKQGRIDIKNDIKNIYDGVYDTEAYKKKGIFRLNDERNIHPLLIGGVGISRKINNRFNLSLEHQVHATGNDYLDGILYRTKLDQSRRDDIQHYTNLRLAYNLGNPKKLSEPLYWVNPLDPVFGDISELKQRPIFDPTDTDQDGVIDLLDHEQETPAGAPVDTRGITLDSDSDGMADYKDEEPYSPPGYQINEKGVAKVPSPSTLNEEDVHRIFNQRVGMPDSIAAKGSAAASGGSFYYEWFLPMIHFNLDEYCVKPQYYNQVHHVATVMQANPKLCVTVFGHTDVRNTSSYNQVLSYNRAKSSIEYLVSKYNISRDRFILMYGGEESPLAGNVTIHYINRRVEFRVCKADDKEMARPEGPEAGRCRNK
ncbi:MAG: OmpA family protein [Bacteroidota bacterium]|nr:OmpA family protein [Bacteroidota bacterium]